MSLSEEEMKQLKKLLSKLDPEQAKKVGISPTLVETLNVPDIPQFWWNPNLQAFKMLLKKVEEKGETSDADLVRYLQSLNLASDTATTDNYGYTYTEAGIFINNDGKVSLSEIGKQIAKLCNAEPTLTTLEIVLFRGLQQQSAGYTYLDIVGRNPGIFREDLMKELEKIYGGNGRYYAGYYTRIFKQLRLVKRTSEHGKARYWLTVHEAWGEKNPDIPEDEE